MKGFVKIATPQKSLLQQVRKTFRQLRLRSRRYGTTILSEVAKIDSPQLLEKSGQNPNGAAFQGIEEANYYLEVKHHKELLESAIDPEIINLNFRSLTAHVPHDYLLYSNNLQRRNDGRLNASDLRRYAHLAHGGWWCSGVDIFTLEDSLWGCFKPNQPRFDPQKGKLIKYETPPKTPTEIFALKIPPRIWELIARRYDVELPEDYEKLPGGEFWRWVCDNSNIPIILVEGAKKAAAILSCGYVCVGLPGIWNAIRQPKDANGEKTGPSFLIPQLKILAQPGRQIYLCFDSDSKHSTIKNVNLSIEKTSKVLTSAHCQVKILSWNSGLGKGIDDVISVYGSAKFDELYRQALYFGDWQTKQLQRLTYPVDVNLNCRYLPKTIEIPASKELISIVSPKNTGKSTLLEHLTDPVVRSGERRLLVLSHRVQLGSALAEKLGVPFITEVRESGQGSHFGMGLCIDSLHLQSQAKFNPDNWRGAWLILDEVMQLIWHLLSSSTCQKYRVAILKNFKSLLFNVVNYGGKIFMADADLSDVAIDFIQELLGRELDTFIIQNEFRFSESWQVNLFSGKDPAQLVNVLRQKLGKGEKHFVCCSAQRAKSRWGTRNLEAYFKNKFPKLRILRIDSETIADKNHPAFGCISKINEIIKDYDLVISSPTIETGISIDEEHFDGVWGIGQGVQAPNSVRQHLSRYRPPVNRYVWFNSIGINRVGNGSTSVKGLLSGEYAKDKANVQKLLEMGFDESLDGHFDNTYLITWAKLGAIINAGMYKYREQIIEDLKLEGHSINEVDPANEELELTQISSTAAGINKTRNLEYSKYCQSVAAAESITENEFLRLDKQASKTEQERLKHHKGELERLYNIEIEPEIVENHDKNWYAKIRLAYYFDKGREFLANRDKNLMSNMLKNGDGDYFKVDSNKSLIGKKIDALDWLRISELLQIDEISNHHELAIDIFKKCQSQSHTLNLILGINFATSKTPIEVCRRLLQVFGLKFPMLRKEGARGQQVRIYGRPAPEFQWNNNGKIVLVDGCAIAISDSREKVFDAWLERDRKAMTAMEIKTQAMAKLQAELDEQKRLQTEWLSNLDDKENLRDVILLASETLETWQEMLSFVPKYVVEQVCGIYKDCQAAFKRWVHVTCV